ncbi:hypothetical protein BDV18DRAFT_52438 [Aspergillus unguis]
MLSYHFRWVLTAVLVLIYFSPVTQATAVSLLDLLPKCASRCVESFINTEYPKNACSKGCDLNYLCTTNTTNGYTLGEAALRCSLSLCSVEVAMSFDSYSICESVPDALPRTHATIVATVTAGPNPTSTTTPAIITAKPETTDAGTITSTTSTESDHTSSKTTTFQSPTSTTTNTRTSTTETEEPTSTSTESSPSPTAGEEFDDSSQSTSLNSGAVIGVSVASGIAGFFIIGVVIFFCCRRMRRKAQDREFFEIGGCMEEPPDFTFPPKRPPRGPRPSPQKINNDPESIRLVQPADQHPIQYPAVVVTQPEENYEYGNVSANNTDRGGVQSAKSDYETASIASSRTVSDLLPDKPTYELYPRPLRWSQHKRSRPSSGATVFEEEIYARPRPLPTPPLQQSGSSQASTRTRRQNRHPPAGLPANPRAMMYGFGSPGQMGTKSSGSGKKPVYANTKDNVQSRQAAIHGTSPHPSRQTEYDDDIDNYWKGSGSDAGFVGAKVIQPQPPAPSQGVAHGLGVSRSSYSEYPGYEFEFGFGDTHSSDPRQGSRHSGGFQFRPLTPVREIRTPMGDVQNPMGEASTSNNYNRRSASPQKHAFQHPYPQEIVSRPRVVRQDDIKRVEIRRGRPSPREVTAPYCPDDYWQEQQNESSSSGYNASSSSGEYIPMPTPTPKPRPKNTPGFGRMPKKKPSPAERNLTGMNLTPSRRGADMILRVQ